MRCRGVLRLATAAAAALVVLPASASAATANSVVMLSDSGDYIGGGQHRLYHAGNSQITITGSTDYLTIGVSGGSSGDAFTMDFAAPPGQVLAPGVYDKAQRAPFREAGRPGIDVSGDGRGCNTIEGRFEVKDFAVTPEGKLDRLWIVYEQHCEGGTAALFGEVRLGIADGSGNSYTAPAVVRWPVNELGRAGTASPVTVLASGPSQLGTVTLAGEHPGDFTVRLDECSGRTLAAGGHCEVWVRFTPTAPGTRSALLRIPDASGSTREVLLQGFTYGGSTKLVMQSDSGDYIGQGKSWSYSTANALIVAGGTRRGVSFGLSADNAEDWSGSFSPADGDIIAPGRYTGATRNAFRGTGPGLDVSGNGRGCNTITGEFTVSEASFDSDGRLRTLGLSFIQHCEGGTPALRGTFEFRKGDATPPPPWMVGGSGTTGTPGTIGQPPPPPGGGGEGSGEQGSTPPATAPAPTKSSPCRAGRSGEYPLIRGSSKADRLRGTRIGEVILAGAGNDVVLAGAGDDCVEGGSGRDALSGGKGADRLYAGTGNDRLDGGPGKDVLNCGAGRDVATVTKGDRVKSCERVVRPRRR